MKESNLNKNGLNEAKPNSIGIDNK